MNQLRLDDLAREAGVATTTVRLYQNKGLLEGPQLEGRTGWYDESHLERLRLIARLQAEGFSLAGIKRLLELSSERGNLDDLIGARTHAALFGKRRAVVVSPAELLERFPPETLSGELIQRAAAMELVTAGEGGRLAVPDERFLDVGATLVRLGVPAGVVLDEWERLSATMAETAARFVDIFERHVLPKDWRCDLTPTTASVHIETLEQLRAAARDVIEAALDASLRQLVADRLADLEDVWKQQRTPPSHGSTGMTSSAM